MIRLLADTKNMTKGTPHGFGIDEDTALVITHGDTNHMNARVSCSEFLLFNLEIFVNIECIITYEPVHEISNNVV